MTMKECLEKAAQVWCKPFCSRKEMDVDLAKGFAETLFEEVNRDHTEILLRGELADAVRGKLNLSYGAIEDLLDRHPRGGTILGTSSTASPKPDTTEPLAVLADRKGYGVHVYREDQVGDVYIRLSKGYRDNWITRYYEKTYALAEAKAREYLSALPDTDNRGGR